VRVSTSWRSIERRKTEHFILLRIDIREKIRHSLLCTDEFLRLGIGAFGDSIREPSGYPIDGSRWQISNCPTDSRGFQPQTIENGTRHGAAKPVGKLIERPVGAKVSEGSTKDRQHLSRRHGKQRQAADHGANRRGRKQVEPGQPRRIRQEHPRLRESMQQEPGKVGTIFNQCELGFGYTTIQKRLGKHTGSWTKLEDGTVAWRYLPGHQASERVSGRCDRRDAQWVGKP